MNTNFSAETQVTADKREWQFVMRNESHFSSAHVETVSIFFFFLSSNGNKVASLATNYSTQLHWYKDKMNKIYIPPFLRPNN